MTPTEQIIDALKAAGHPPKRGGTSWSACCPVHDDTNPSLTVSEGDDGCALLCCHAGCDVDSIVSALGLTVADLWPDRSGQKRQRAATKPRPREVFPTAGKAVAKAKSWRGPADHAWAYRNADGELVGLVLRWDREDGKDILPVSRNGDGWIIGGMAEPRPLYRHCDIADPGRVYVHEGEPAADAGRSIGLVSVTSAGGSKAPHKTDWTPLAGKDVVIVPDNDRPGEKYAETVVGILHGLDPKPTVRIVRLPGLPEGGDMADYLEALDCKALDDLRSGIEALVQAVPIRRPADDDWGPVLVCLADVVPKPVRWLWPGRIPLSKLTILSGDPELGKSTLTLDLAARVSRGRSWPDDAGGSGEPGDVVLISAEDDIEDTIRPRIDVAGGDVNRIFVLKAIRVPDPDSGECRENMFSLKHDLAGLETALDRCRNPRLVVIDPISAYLDGTESHKNSDVRSLLTPLVESAARREVAVVAVSHLNKSGAGKAIYRTMASLAFVAAARAGWLVVADKDDPERVLFLRQKANLAAKRTGLAYRIEPSDGAPEYGVICWEPEPVTISADEALAAARGDNEERPQLDYAVAWLKTALADGPMLANEVLDQAKQNNIAEKTLRRAQAEIGIKPDKGGYGGPWSWSLPVEGGQDGQG